MATKKLKGLGRGLEALLGGDGDFTQQPADAGSPSSLPVTQLQAGKYQPRTRMDEGALNELAASIKSQGVMQPVLVRPVGQEGGITRYEIIAGERRFRAAQLAGLESIPVLVREDDDQAAAAMAISPSNRPMPAHRRSWRCRNCRPASTSRARAWTRAR